MTHALFAAVLLAAAPESSLEGLYAAIGGGGSLLIVPGDNTFGYDAELRLGYSFNPATSTAVPSRRGPFARSRFWLSSSTICW
jgi:hypothetical protein